MDVIILLIFISIVLATCGVGFFIWNLREHAHEHGSRLSLLPLENDKD